MTNAKITLPSEVIEAIEELRTLEFTNAEILMCAVNRTQPHTVTTYTIHEWASANKSHDILMQALVNGYTVVKTPKELVRDYYDRCEESRRHYFSAGNREASQFYAGQEIGVSITLDILGIKLEGVSI